MHTPVYSFKKNVRKENKLVPVKSFKSDALTIGPKYNYKKPDRLKDTPPKSIKKPRPSGRMRKVENIQGPPKITREQALRRLRTKLNEWRLRVLKLYNDAWTKLLRLNPDRNEEQYEEVMDEFDYIDMEITVVLLLFEEKEWSHTHFRKERSSGETPEWAKWEIWLKLLMDNLHFDSGVGDRITPEQLNEALTIFIRETTNNVNFLSQKNKDGTPRKFDEKTLLEMSLMLTEIAEGFIPYYIIYDYSDVNGLFNSFKDHLSERQTAIASVAEKLTLLKYETLKKYKEELEKQSRGINPDFTLVWKLIQDISEVDLGYERDDPRLWVFNDTETFIPRYARETYHDIKPDQLEKMWDLFISNVLDNIKQVKLLMEIESILVKLESVSLLVKLEQVGEAYEI